MRRLRIQDWSLGRVVSEMDGRLVSSTIEVGSLTGVSKDSRTIEEGELYFALRGERFDGHQFVEEAIASGACAVVVDNMESASGLAAPAIVVDDCVKALARLGHSIFRAARQDGLHAVAITGSNGKTTTKEFLAALWALDGSVWATPGNLNNHIGVPLTLCAIPTDCDHLIVEMGANHRGEISQLIELAPADHRIVTSIGQAHLEGFGSMAGVRKAKSEIFENASRATTAIVPFGERQALIPESFPGHCITFGPEADADMRVISTDPTTVADKPALEVVFASADRRWTLNLPFLGEHNALNLAAAVSTLPTEQEHFDEAAINQALQKIELPGGRLRIETVGELEIMDDAYNANPSSMRASFRAFEHWCNERPVDSDHQIVAVIGTMNELGDGAGRAHRRLARWLASRPLLSALVFVGDFAAPMAEEARAGFIDDVMVHSSLDEVCQWLHDCGPARVFLKASRSDRLERVVKTLQSLPA